MNLEKDLSFENYSNEEHFLDAIAGKWFRDQITIINYFALAKYCWKGPNFSANSLKDRSEQIIENRAQILSIRKSIFFRIYFGKYKWMIRAAYIIENNQELLKEFYSTNNEKSSKARFTFYFHSNIFL